MKRDAARISALYAIAACLFCHFVCVQIVVSLCFQNGGEWVLEENKMKLILLVMWDVWWRNAAKWNKRNARGMQQDREALKEFSLLVTICLLAYVFQLEEEVCCRCYSLFFHYGSSVAFWNVLGKKIGSMARM